MNEQLLHYIWRFQYFNKQHLLLQSGEELQVMFGGNYNTHEGPDFSEGRIRIDQTQLIGHIEMHVRTTDWFRHGHSSDPHYDNVILHVVWEDDSDKNEMKLSIPLLELKTRVSKLLLTQYDQWMGNPSFIPCEQSIGMIRGMSWHAWKDRLVAERLLRKSAGIKQYLQANNGNWEESFWWLIARNFGIKVNADCFEAIAKTLPLPLLARHKEQPVQLEALLFGQAGLLRGKFKEEYPKQLKKEYAFLQHKYKLRPVLFPVFFLRMRPVNFPTIRLSQLATLIHHAHHLFSGIRDTTDIKHCRQNFNVSVSDYWLTHYRFDEPTAHLEKKTGQSMIDLLLINSICPILFTYGQETHQQNLSERAMNWLMEANGEQNSIIRSFTGLGIESKSAFDTQALLELKSQYCDARRCLECTVGNKLLEKSGGR